VELVLVQVQRTHLEEGEQAEVDFHPHCHHLKEETRIGTKEGTNAEDGSQAEEGTITELGSQAKIFSSNLTSLLIIISLQCG
jgi:hypothetical protein